MRLRNVLPAVGAFAALLIAGCNHMPGAPRAQELARPEDQLDFTALYKTNCQGCHGVNGKNGAAYDLSNPEFQALIDDENLKMIVTLGMPGCRMPAFSRQAGAMLTDEQIDALVKGMRQVWLKPAAFGNDKPPAYDDDQKGDTAHGQLLYSSHCASCHKDSPQQQVTSPDYLALMSDQALRTIIIAGRPDLGQPDWRNDKPGQPLSGQDVTDIVAYLGSLRNPASNAAAPAAPVR